MLDLEVWVEGWWEGEEVRVRGGRRGGGGLDIRVDKL